MLFSSNILLRRYTPPTCTLEIWTKRTLLQRWQENALSRELRFELRFDDPRLVDDQLLTIRGDRSGLELLCDVVSCYVQNFLNQTPAQFKLVSETALENTRSVETIPTALGENALVPPSLQPRGLLNHELFLGSLAEQASQSSLDLSASQLFDLANALDDYSSDTSLFSPLPRRSSRHKAIIVWVGGAAAAVIAVALPTVGIKLLQETQQSRDPASLGDSAKLPKGNGILNVLPPVPPPPSSPLPSPSLPPSLANGETLPPPSQIGQINSPSRNSTPGVQVPPPRVLPPPPAIPSAPPAVANKSPSQSIMMLPAPKASTVPLYGTTSQGDLGIPHLSSPPPLSASSNSQDSVVATSRLQPNESTAVTPSLLDTIPQVAQARQYLQQRWQPPEDLKQTLEYRLIVKPNGTLERAIPLGKAATLYLTQSGIPSPGESFVSPLNIAGNQTIRTVLSPDGNVKTFLEEQPE